MKISRIIISTVGDCKLYVLGVKFENKNQYKKLENKIKEWNTAGEIPISKLEKADAKYFSEDLKIVTIKQEISDKEYQYEVVFFIMGKEELAKPIYDKIKMFVKEQEEKGTKRKRKK